MTGADDDRFMQRALELARAQLGRTAPNPSVGCVIVREGRVIAEAATGAGGRPHAEETALALLEVGAAAGAEVYVTLEPCGSRSRGGVSCASLLIAARPSRVVAAIEDPHPHGAGGIAALLSAGILVRVGVCAEEARALNAGFFHRVETGRPLASITADGAGFDANFQLEPGEDAPAALDRLGRAGLTRVYAHPGSAEAEALIRCGLVQAPPRDG